MNFILCICFGLMVFSLVALVWSIATLYYIDLHYDHIQKRIDEIYSENIKRIRSCNYNFIDYNIVDKEPSPYWVIRVNQKLGLW